jgi:geranylgeranyl diphosphate synthase type II
MNNLENLVDYFEKAFREEIQTIGLTAPHHLYEPITYSLKMGGKRIRPALLLHAASLYTNSIGPFLPVAMAIEIFHNFTLLHDDIMDKADVRRNQPTVHKKYNENVAILSGDAMSILAFKYFAKGNTTHLAELLPLFSETAIEVCEGQQHDMDFETRVNVTVDEYLEMIRLKTAVLIASSLKLGALLANAPDKDACLFYEYGLNVGLAFQLQDDWLDVYGDPDVFGKKKGGDICANKKTFLLLKAMEACDPSNLEILNQWLLRSEFDPQEKIDAFIVIYDQTGVSVAAQNLMREYHDKALAALDEINLPSGEKNVLVLFAGEVMKRIK